MMPTRDSRRHAFDDATKFQLIHDDLDSHDHEFELLRDELKGGRAEAKAGFDELAAQARRNTQVLIGILVSVIVSFSTYIITHL